MKPTPDAVLSLLNWWDGPLEGTTTFDGAPHRFNRVAQAPSRQGYAGIYELTPLSPDVAALEAEVWIIWSRWRAAWKTGETPRETWPALPIDSERYKRIKAAIATAPKANFAIRCRGVFVGSNEDLHLCSSSTGVRWTKTAESTP